MKQSRKSIILLIAILWLSRSFAQDIFNEQNTALYANYLFQAGQYKLSSVEYLRLVSLDTNNMDYKLMHVRALRMNKNSDLAINIFNSYNLTKGFLSSNTEAELLRLYIDSRQFKKCRNTIASSQFISEEEKTLFSTISLMKENRFTEAEKLLKTKNLQKNENLDNLFVINKNCLLVKTKSPFLSGFLSTLLPGMGKVYSGYWQDGLLSLVMTGTTAYQTYRAFQKAGIKSYYGWISASLTCGFYFGNIYGSVKSAHKHNHIILEPYQMQIEEVYNHIN